MFLLQINVHLLTLRTCLFKLKHPMELKTSKDLEKKDVVKIPFN